MNEFENLHLHAIKITCLQFICMKVMAYDTERQRVGENEIPQIKNLSMEVLYFY